MDAADVARISLFTDLSEVDRERVAALFDKEEKVLPGRRPAIQGEYGYRFYVILEGEVIVRVDGEPAKTLGPDDFFGEMALLEKEGKRTAEVEATTHTRYASMIAWQLRDLLDEIPELRAKVEAAIEGYRLGDVD